MIHLLTGIGLYVHIPFCQRKCPYCAFYSVPMAGQSPNRLVGALLEEIDLYEITEPVETIYIGGGSPTCLPPEILIGLIVFLKNRFGDVEEFTVECNPAQVNRSLFEQLLAAGVNRLSIGAQSFDADELKILGRLHGPGQITEAVKAAQSAGIENIGLDLIFGLPRSKLIVWQNTLDKAMQLGVQHISAYSLTLERDTPFERAAQQGDLTMIDEVVERTMYELARIQLPSDGFRHYEISNFGRPGFECCHNMHYWKNRPVVGIGPAAASWYRNRRTMNVHDIDVYIEAIENGQFAHIEVQTPTPEQIASETAVLNLRLPEGIDIAEYRHQTGFDVEALFPDAIEKNWQVGFLQCSESHICLSDVGLSFADAVAQDFVL
ncbi:MAG: radical SAM family heme chaperone HemW [Phycisphaerae bacterium]|nr:radical SAM family heme chaperone HemW [Phycisphaerae bacterium]